MEHKDTSKQTKMSADRKLVEANIQGGLILDSASRSGVIPKNINHPPAHPLNKDPTLTLNIALSFDDYRNNIIFYIIHVSFNLGSLAVFLVNASLDVQFVTICTIWALGV